MGHAPRLLHAEFELHAYYIYTQEQIKFPFEEESSFFIPYTCTRSLSFIRGRFFHGNFRSIFLVFFSLPSFILLNTNIQQCVVKFFYRPCVFFFFLSKIRPALKNFSYFLFFVSSRCKVERKFFKFYMLIRYFFNTCIYFQSLLSIQIRKYKFFEISTYINSNTFNF